MFHLKIDSSLERYLKAEDPFLKDYMAFKEKFGQQDKVLLGIYSDDVFSRDFLMSLKKFHQALETQVPYAVEVGSLLTLDIFKNSGNQLSVSNLMGGLPVSEASLKVSTDMIRTTPIYKNRYFSENGKFTIVFVSLDPCLSHKYQAADPLEGFFKDLLAPEKELPGSHPCFLTEKENDEMIEAVSKTVLKYSRENFRIHTTGLPVYKQFIRKTMQKDAATFVTLSSLVILFFLHVFFRSREGIWLPFVIVLCSMISTLGLMVLFNRPIKTPTTILPSLLLVVGLGDSIHILNLYYQNLANGLCREKAMTNAVGKSGRALLITSLTTAVGIASFSSADVAPVADLGLFGCMGVMIAFVYTLVLLPASLALLPGKDLPKTGVQARLRLDKVLDRIAVFSTRYAGIIVASSLIMALVCTAGVMKLKITHNPLLWLSKAEPIRQATEKIDKEINGMINVEILIQAKNGDTVQSPAMLKSIERLHRYFKENTINGIRVDKTFSIVDIVKFTHFVLNNGHEAFYRIPENPSAIFQQLLLVEMGSWNLIKELTGLDDHTARFTAYAPWVDAVAYGPFLDEIQMECREIFGNGYHISITGQIPLLARTLSATIHSMVKSYKICVVTITALMILLLASVRMGFFSMIPNLLPVWISMGIMGWFKFPLDMYTLLVGSIVLGIIVDDTVHFMHYFNRYRSEGFRVEDACAMTLKTAGPAMLITTAVISSGAVVFLLSTLNSLRYFGAAVAGVSILSLLCDLIFVPALVTLVLKDKKE